MLRKQLMLLRFLRTLPGRSPQRLLLDSLRLRCLLHQALRMDASELLYAKVRNVLSMPVFVPWRQASMSQR